MSILTANLKHLYQRRGLWLVYGFLGLIVFVCIAGALDHTAAGKGQFIGFVLLAFIIGFLTAVLPLEVVTKPFSYCLPGHRKTVRKFILWVGVVINFLGSLLFLMYPGLYSWHLILVVCSAFFANLIFYWLGVGCAFSLKNSVFWIAFLPFAIFLAGSFFDLHIVLESAVVQYPIAVVCVGILSSILAWFRLGDTGLARRYCAAPWLGLFDAWNRDRLQRYRQARAAIKWDKLKKHPNPRVERFFLTRIQSGDYFKSGRYVWGGLYTTFAVAMSRWTSTLSGLFVALLFVSLFCYMDPMAVTFALFFMPAFMVAHIRLPVYSSMLVVGGRNERFFTVLTLVATSAVLITAVATAIAALTMPLPAIMPDITLRGTTFTFHAAYLQPFFIPLLMIPIVFTIQLFFLKKPFFVMVTVMLLFVLFFTGVSGLKALSTMLNPIFLVAGLLVLSWVIFVTVLYYICMRRCLVGQ
jgi:hypothetical protein